MYFFALLDQNNQITDNDKSYLPQSEHVDIKNELAVKEEPVEATDATADVSSDGRIDLNFYLQQAIQSASMPCPLCKKVSLNLYCFLQHIRKKFNVYEI